MVPTSLPPSLPRFVDSTPSPKPKENSGKRVCSQKQCFRVHNFSTQSAKNFCKPVALARIVSYSTSPPSQIRTHSIKNQPLGLVFTNILVFLDSRNRQESNKELSDFNWNDEKVIIDKLANKHKSSSSVFFCAPILSPFFHVQQTSLTHCSPNCFACFWIRNDHFCSF